MQDLQHSCGKRVRYIKEIRQAEEALQRVISEKVPTMQMWLCGLWDWLNTYLSNHRDEPLWTLVIFWLNRVLTHVHCHPCGRFCFVCFPSLSRSAGFQEFSQKELAAKTVSLNQLNDQSTSEVRESVVSQAGSNILFFPEICDQSCQTSPSRRRVQLKSNSLERPSLGSFTDVTGYILKVW